MLVIWFVVGFLISQFVLGDRGFQIIKEEGELITEQQRIYDYVSKVNQAIVSKGGEISTEEVNMKEVTTTADFIDSLLVGMKLEIDLSPNNLATVLHLLGDLIHKQPNIIWKDGKLEIYSKSKSEILSVMKKANKMKMRWLLSRIEENMQ